MGLALHARHGEAARVGQARRPFAEDDDIGLRLAQPRFHAVPQRGDLACPREVALGELGGGPETHNAGGVLGAAAQASLLTAAVDKRRDLES